MAENLEIERKFLVKFPDFNCLNPKRKIDILQIYLENGSNGSQRRVRRIVEDNITRYFYTEKIFYSAVIRDETEYEISKEEYKHLLFEKRADYTPIEKSRICFEYREQLFELDIYPFSDKWAILELELENAEQEIFFPNYINVVKEVTGIEEYSNASLANAGKFPDYKES
ncbi:MAG: hypothetical protein K2J47_06510 [Ruminococcus sp.]|nr:hypothetical protein [Ruminococcus sp.]